MNKINNFIKELSANPLLLIMWVAIIIIAIIGIKKLITYIMDAFVKNSSNTVSINKNNLSYDENVYYSMAETLFAAMSGWGSDEQKIYDVLVRMNTKDDWAKTKAVFGVRKGGMTDGYFQGTLIAWLQDELSVSEIQKANEILAKIGERI